MSERIRLFDFHTQTLEHGLNKPLRVEETIRAAINKKLSDICLTDHYPLPPGFADPTKKRDCAMPMSRYEEYQRQVGGSIKRYSKQIQVLRGAEFDWLPDYSSWTEEEIKRWQFDYVIGSVHFAGEIEDEWGKRPFAVDYKKEEFDRGLRYYGGMRQLTAVYYRKVREMVISGLFDTVAHLDLIKKYNDGSYFEGKQDWYKREVLETLDVIARVGMAMELNTSGWFKVCKAPYPSRWILVEAYKRGINLTIGSDGHKPEEIGRNLDEAVMLAKSAGYKFLARYRDRKRELIEIESLIIR